MARVAVAPFAGNRVTNALSFTSGHGNSFSLVVWFYTADQGLGHSYNAIGNLSNNTGIWWRPSAPAAHKLAWYANSTHALDPSTTTLGIGEWHHTALTCNGVTDSCTAYIDGVVEGTFPCGATPTSTSEFSVFADNFPSFSDNAEVGLRCADVALWSVELSPLEMVALSKGVRPCIIQPRSLVIYWPLYGLSSPEPDLSGNARNGTLDQTDFAFGPPLMQYTPRRPAFLESPPVTAPPLTAQIWL